MNVSLKDLLKKTNIMYVSENNKLCKKTIGILKLFFNKIHYKDTSYKAITDFTLNDISAIITEIDLIDRNGIDFIKEIRKLNKSIPIIVLTENRKIEVLIEAIKLNLIEYLLKPVDTNKLIFAINKSAKEILNNGEITTKITNKLTYHYLDKKILSENIKIDLTKNEVILIELLLSNKNKIIKNENIKKHIWTNKNVSDSAFKTLFSRLNKKIGKETITNSFGVGYGIYDR